ncbi:TonB-dependent receptor [Novosphingobium sp.]|uniref:TonB-dependent receptor n=1 Tax=Novosphingobium sp. TaxID=1874826 RepID=UPI00260E7498|nr:TonB-dependent receptor [Novosphingobium sp.]
MKALKLILGASAAAIAVPVFAQDASDSVEGGIGEIVVTAQRRSESIQKIPVSLTAVGSDELRSRQINDLVGVAQAAPSLQIGTDASFSVRGVGTLAFAGTIDSSVALAIDEVNLGRPTLGAPLLMDVERVEVLNGPQGLLFGKNASAGLLNIVTAKPRLGEFSGGTDVEVTFRETPGADRDAPGIIARQVLNIPISANSALRINALYGYQEPPVTRIDAIAPGRRDDLNRRNVQLKAKYLLEASEALSLYVIGDYNKLTGAGAFFDRTWRSFGAASTRRAVYENAGGTAGPDNFLLTGDGGAFRDIETGGAQATIRYELDSGLELSNIFAWRYYSNDQSLDIDYLPIEEVNVNANKARYDQYSNEFRIALPSDSPLSGQFGLFYYKSTLDQANDIFGNLGFPPFLLPQYPFCVGAVATPGAPPGTCSVSNSFFIGRDTDFLLDTQSYAGFGQLTYEVVPGLRLIAGGRYTRDEIRLDLSHGRRNYFATLSGPNGRYREAFNANNFSWKLGAQYQVTPDILLFGFQGRGYKGPGFNDTSIVGTNGTAFVPAIRPEISNTTEVGIKTAFFDRKLTFNVSVYRTTFDDYQVQSLDTVLQTFVVQNAAKVKTQGVEVGFTARPVTGLSINGGLSFLDAKFLSFPGAQCFSGQTTPGCAASGTFDAAGLRLPVSPKFTSTMQATYDLPVSGDMVPFLQGSWYHRSSVNHILNGAPGGFFRAVDTFGANIGIKLGVTLQASLFCKNCTNEHVPQSISLDAGEENDGIGSYGQVFGLDSVRSFGMSLSLRY